MKLDETTKFKDALIRMEDTLARDNCELWDKHDCAEEGAPKWRSASSAKESRQLMDVHIE